MDESEVVDSLADKMSAEDLAEASVGGALAGEFPVVCSAASSASGRPL